MLSLHAKPLTASLAQGRTNVRPKRAGSQSSRPHFSMLQPMKSAKPEVFRLLNDEEFRHLSTQQKVAYMKRAMEAQKTVNSQIAEGLFHLAPKDSEKKKEA